MKKIISVEINNANFFESPIEFKFSDSLNCVMGGRGTGKSTLLHFIKACIQPGAEDDRTTYNILRNNLGEGVISLVIQGEDGKKYKIQKSLEDFPQAYRIPGDHFIDLNSILEEVDCDIYEAQAIEEIGKNNLDRLKLIDKMVGTDKNSIETDIKAIQLDLNNNCRLIQSEIATLNELTTNLKSFEGVEAELNEWVKDKPEDIKKDEQQQFEEADRNEKVRTAEKRYVTGTNKRLDDLEANAREMTEALSSFSTFAKNTSGFVNVDEIGKIQSEIAPVIQHFDRLAKEGIVLIETAKKKVNFISSQLNEKHGIQQNEFTRLKQKFEKHKIFYNKWNALTKKIDEKKHVEKEIAELSKKKEKLKANRKKLVEKLNLKKKELFDLRKAKVDLLNKQFNGSIKITLTFNGIVDEYEQLLRNALKGSNMRYNAIVPNIVQNLTPDKLASIVHERDYNSLKTITGIDKERSDAIINALCDTESIYQIECLYCADLPEFLLKIDAQGQASQKGKENYKKSDELSTGQRCTTVLPIVFAVSDNPLIIDQPEDNLDNKYISETIHGIIREQKKTRQLIFITHNPNIPVLSDSDQNFFLNYSEKKSKVDKEGDIEGVKINILNLLEGGKEAFEKREKLYSKKVEHA